MQKSQLCCRMITKRVNLANKPVHKSMSSYWKPKIKNQKIALLPPSLTCWILHFWVKPAEVWSAVVLVVASRCTHETHSFETVVPGGWTSVGGCWVNAGPAGVATHASIFSFLYSGRKSDSSAVCSFFSQAAFSYSLYVICLDPEARILATATCWCSLTRS